MAVEGGGVFDDTGTLFTEDVSGDLGFDVFDEIVKFLHHDVIVQSDLSTGRLERLNLGVKMTGDRGQDCCSMDEIFLSVNNFFQGIINSEQHLLSGPNLG